VIAREVGSVVNLGRVGGQMAQVGAAVLGGIALYVVAAKLLRVDELRPLMGIVAGRFRKGEA
jgi:hypothetical protein